MATKLGDITVGGDGSWSSGPHTMTAGSKSVTLRRKSDGAVLVTRNFTVAAAGGITFVAAGAHAYVNSTNQDVAMPSGLQSGDIIIMFGSGSYADQAGTGWTLKASSPWGGGFYWKRTTGTEPAVTWVFDDGEGGSVPFHGRTFAFRGCIASGDPFDATDAAGGSATAATVTGSALTLASAGSVIGLVAFGGATISSPGGSIDTLTTSNANSGADLALGYDATPPAGSGLQSAPTLSLSSSVAHVKWTFSLKKA